MARSGAAAYRIELHEASSESPSILPYFSELLSLMRAPLQAMRMALGEGGVVDKARKISCASTILDPGCALYVRNR